MHEIATFYHTVKGGGGDLIFWFYSLATTLLIYVLNLNAGDLWLVVQARVYSSLIEKSTTKSLVFHAQTDLNVDFCSSPPSVDNCPKLLLVLWREKSENRKETKAKAGSQHSSALATRVCKSNVEAWLRRSVARLLWLTTRLRRFFDSSGWTPRTLVKRPLIKAWEKGPRRCTELCFVLF